MEVNEQEIGFTGSVYGIISLKSEKSFSPSSFPPGIDLIIVVDKSGSMAGMKLKLVKESLVLLIMQMRSHDRFSIVAFNNTTEIICGLRLRGNLSREEITKLVDRIKSSGTTSICNGIAKSLDILLNRVEKNSVASILLLTDGDENNGGGGGGGNPVDKVKNIFADPNHGVGKEIGCGLTIHTFGYGVDHNQEVCSAIASYGRGMYTYIEKVDEKSVKEVFAASIGGLMSVVAQNIEIKIWPSTFVEMMRVHTSFEKYDVMLPIGHTVVYLPNMYLDERRDIVVEFGLMEKKEAGQEEVLCKVDVHYNLPVIKTATEQNANTVTPDQNSANKHDVKIKDAAFLKILRPKSISDYSRDAYVNVQVLRQKASETMLQAKNYAYEGNYGLAKDILQNQILEIEDDDNNTKDSTCIALINDLDNLMDYVTPEHFARDHGAMLLSASQISSQQRSIGRHSLLHCSDIFMTESQLNTSDAFASNNVDYDADVTTSNRSPIPLHSTSEEEVEKKRKRDDNNENEEKEAYDPENDSEEDEEEEENFLDEIISESCEETDEDNDDVIAWKKENEKKNKENVAPVEQQKRAKKE